MVVGVCFLHLHIYESNSLKSKRHVLRQIIDRTRNKFNVAIAEVGDNDRWQSAQLGFCVVGNESGHVNSMVDKVYQFIDTMHAAEIYHSHWELIHF
ncbi:MAG TPA: DUF503 domain-containing protein [Thermodesulfobacteriota bacterium]|nr:DUF503 domain-containing protein [Deltaproteobacteria bacterium]HNR11774.1 DUF503 domain-containing protein [Thermodesulfobacteriota bacterium]HNU72393.1 DUF503 domain-containing protein [Thermodesulfobacteriota bacterium]HOC38210.1 DUF503 domain-containing protein [Thermodesulfobacteriota bacterium]HQO77861.1 DUF503 domain-containing protein [Thermodesulfobacteriota bacterium]